MRAKMKPKNKLNIYYAASNQQQQKTNRKETKRINKF